MTIIYKNKDMGDLTVSEVIVNKNIRIDGDSYSICVTASDGKDFNETFVFKTTKVLETVADAETHLLTLKDFSEQI